MVELQRKNTGAGATLVRGSRIGRALGVLVLLAVSVAVAVGIGEAVCRATGLGGIILYERGLYRSSGDQRLVYELTPGFAGHSYGTKVVVDSLGFRGPEFSSTPARGVYRIVCVGDSFTFGMGVEYDQSWPKRLERKVAPPRGFQSVEVINAGVPGYNLTEYCEEIICRVIPLKPNLVIIGLVGNDLAPSFFVNHGYLCVPLKRTTLPVPAKRWLQTHSYLYQFLNMKYQAYVAARLQATSPEVAHELLWQDTSKVEWEKSRVFLERCRQELDRRRIKLTAVELWLPPVSPLRQVVRGAGVNTLAVKLEDKDRLEDGHPNAAGHESIAGQIAAYLPHVL